jgi:hypothetical protein
MNLAEDAVAQRLQGRQASRPKALATAAVAGVAAAVLAYKLLRRPPRAELE